MVIWLGDTLESTKGPPERSMAGSIAAHDGFQPTFSMMWAGSRSEKSVRQSAKGFVKVTVTVSPLLLGTTEAMSR